MAVKSFPRGGKKPLVKPSNNLFAKRTKVKTRKPRPKQKSVEDKPSVDEPIVSNSASNLRYSSLTEGMILLGRIYKVTDYYAIVSLPGQISAKLQATDICESYTNLLTNLANNEEVSDEFKPLPDLYKEGDYVVCYVKELQHGTKKISVSLEPQLVNQYLNPTNLSKCSKVVVTVGSVEDHGYVLETGLKNFRAFMSTKDIGDSDIELFPGKQIVCAVKEIKSAENTLTAKVSIKPKHLEPLETNVVSLNNVFPCIQYSLIVTRILKDGLQVEFGKQNIGYINQLYLSNALSTFKKGQSIVGTLLYILPTVKFSFFTLLPVEKEKKLLSVGDIIPKARVLSHDPRGILLQLKKKIRGFLPMKRTEVLYEKIPSVFATDSVHKCKVIAYDLIAKLYICTMEKKLMEKEIKNVASLKAGDNLEVTVQNINETSGHMTVATVENKITGTVPPHHIADPASNNKLKIGQKVIARVLKSSPIIFTLKPSLVSSKLPILSKFEDATINSIHDGTVTQIIDQGVLITFFDNVKGWIPKRMLNKKLAPQKWLLTVGQTVTIKIKGIDVNANKLTLNLLKNNTAPSNKVSIGDVVDGVVTDSSIDGIKLEIKQDNEEVVEAFLPAGHISPSLEVGRLFASKTVPGDKLSAIVFSTKPNLILSTTFVPPKTFKTNNLKADELVLCSVKKINKESVKVLLPLVNSSKFGVIPIKDFGNLESTYENQILYGKVTKINKENEEINLTTQLSKVWKEVDGHEIKMMTAVDVLSSYLNTIGELSKNIYYASKPISKLTLGQRVKGVVENVMDSGLILKLDNDVRGIVRSNNFTGTCKKGDKVEGSILWINYAQEYVDVTLNHLTMNSISPKQNKLAEIPIGVQLRGEIVLVTDWLVLVALKGQGKGSLVALPVRRHLNDTSPDLSPYQIGNKVRCYGVLNKEEANIFLPICLVKSAFEIVKQDLSITEGTKRKIEAVEGVKEESPVKKVKKTKKQEKAVESTQPVVVEDLKPESKAKKAKKTKNQQITVASTETVAVEDVKQESKAKKAKKTKQQTVESREVEAEKVSKPPKAPKIEETKKDESAESPKKSTKSSQIAPLMGEVGFQWNTSTAATAVDDSSSDEEEETDESKPKKKKKLTSAEKRELEFQKEQEIRKCEEAWASGQLPQTIDQFDRLVLSSPDSSLIWVHYMAHHLQATEVDKARNVARRALRTINFREENERLNVWQAWLNLESRFGTTESLNDVFSEAIRNNDALKVYRFMLTVHLDAGRQPEVEKLANVMVSKFKQEPETWISCGEALLKAGLKDKSRHIMQRALQSLPSNKHVNLMVKFALLENKFGEKERSQTIFEQILSSYPKRKDVRATYNQLFGIKQETA